MAWYLIYNIQSEWFVLFVGFDGLSIAHNRAQVSLIAHHLYFAYNASDIYHETIYRKHINYVYCSTIS